MAKLLQTLIAFLLLAALANQARSQSPSTSFGYNFILGRPTTVTYQGDAHFIDNQFYLHLTATDPDFNSVGNSVGRVVHTAPVLFRDDTGAQADFQTSIDFFITPTAVESIAAEGLAFFIAPVGSDIPESSFGGNLGIFGADGKAPNVFAVEFDIFPDAEWDPSFEHIGIDLGSRRSNYTMQVSEGLVGKLLFFSVYYSAAAKTITVRYAAGSDIREITMIYDLGGLLTDKVQVGLSASTGYFSARHQVRSWSFSSEIKPAAAEINQVV